MSTATVLLIAIPLMVVLALAIVFTTTRRRDARGLGHLSAETKARDRAFSSDGGERATVSGRDIEKAAVLARTGGSDIVVRAEPQPPEPWSPPDEDVVGVTRRQFLNRSAVTMMILGLTGFGAACLAFLWPKARGGFGAVVTLGSVGDVQAAIDSGAGTNAPGFAYFVDSQTYVTNYPSDAIDAARAVYDPALLPGMEAGFVALWQKCPHLGCKVPACATSQWFECPCHGSKYNQAGEKRAGPAPRGMDRFPIAIDSDNFTVDTGAVKLGPAIGTDTTAQGPEGAFCTDVGE